MSAPADTAKRSLLTCAIANKKRTKTVRDGERERVGERVRALCLVTEADAH